MTPAARAAKEAKTKAGIFPPPNKASHGPAPRDTIIYKHNNLHTKSTQIWVKRVSQQGCKDILEKKKKLYTHIYSTFIVRMF